MSIEYVPAPPLTPCTSPDRHSILHLIKYCGHHKDLQTGKLLHQNILQKRSLAKDVYINNALIRMYARCGDIDEAQRVFDRLPRRTVVSWNALISGYVQHGFEDKALQCFRRMQEQELSPNIATFMSMLKAYNKVGSVDVAQEIYQSVCKHGLLGKSLVLDTTLLDAFAKSGLFEKAREIFEILPSRDVVCWSVMIAGYVQHGLNEEALKCFSQMRDEGIPPDVVTYVCILKACSNIGLIEMGEEIHAEVNKQGLLTKNIALGTALVGMYVKCGTLEKAQEAFNVLPEKNIVSWTVLIAGYVDHGHSNRAIMLFNKMRAEGLSPDAVTFNCILKACANMGYFEIGEKVHAEICRMHLLEKNPALGNALLDMYAKCGIMDKAQEVFDGLVVQNLISWSSLIAGYVQHGCADNALKCFTMMQNKGLTPDAVVFLCILKACSSIGSLQFGEAVHLQVSQLGLLGSDDVLCTALVDMYAKCGAFEKALDVFNKLSVRGVVSWNALKVGYARLGQAQRVSILYRKMIAEGVVPDLITFTVLLTACSRAGLVKEGQEIFNDMVSVYGLTPTLEQFNCMVELFGYAGNFNSAIIISEKVPPSNRLQLWLGILGACCRWVNLEVGRWAFEQAVQFDQDCTPAYICMRNIYASNTIR